MKRITIVIMLLTAGGLIAQFEAPEILGVRAYFFNQNQCADVLLHWSEITDPEFDHYESYWDGEFQGEMTGFLNWLFMYVDFTLNMYHTAGVKAVYFSGESEISTINFYLSEPLYANPQNLRTVPDYENNSALFQWDEPLTTGDNPPLPISYDTYLNGEFLETTTELEYLFQNLVYGDSYITSIAVNYEDGLSSLMFHNIARHEFYFSELDPPDQISIDSENGIISWQNPGQGDIIGGSMMNLVAPIFWHLLWGVDPVPEVVPAQFGDDINFVNAAWGFASWNHKVLQAREAIWFEHNYLIPPTLYAATDVSHIDQMNDASSLYFGEESVYLLDKDTSVNGFGDFVVLFNSDTGHYGAFQLLDVYEYIDEFMMMGPGLSFHANWWFQTNGSADFSEATRYFPLFYNIYLDDSLIDNVKYEMVINDNGTSVIIDSTLTPTNQFEYQFEDLVVGQEYTAGIEAVYPVGTSSIETFDFIYGNTEAGNQIVNLTCLNGNYPNPFNPETTISFSTTESTATTELSIFNLKGQKVKTLINEKLSAGQYSLVWQGIDDSGKSVSSGVYFYKMKSGNYQETKKMILLR